MNINVHAMNWCKSKYSLTDEAFYMENARFLLTEGWRKGTLKALFFALFESLLLGATIGKNGEVITLLIVFSCSFPAFLIYALMTYWADDKAAGKFYYVMIVALGVWTRIKWFDASWVKFLAEFGSLASLIGYIVVYQKMRHMKKAFDKLADEQAVKDAQRETEDFEKWKSQFYGYNYQNSSSSSSYASEDNGSDASSFSLHDKARELFSEHMLSKQTLKKRYRELAKLYHPDNGGDGDLFAAIVRFYEDNKEYLPN